MSKIRISWYIPFNDYRKLLLKLVLTINDHRMYYRYSIYPGMQPPVYMMQAFLMSTLKLKYLWNWFRTHDSLICWPDEWRMRCRRHRWVF